MIDNDSSQWMTLEELHDTFREGSACVGITMTTQEKGSLVGTTRIKGERS